MRILDDDTEPQSPPPAASASEAPAPELRTPRPAPKPPEVLIAPYFDKVATAYRLPMSFEQYQRVPAVNASLLRQATPYEMLEYLTAMDQLNPESQWLVDARGADVAEALGMVEELKPRTVPQMFVVKGEPVNPALKITKAQQALVDSLTSTPVSAKDFHAATLNICLTNGWAQKLYQEVEVPPVSESVAAGRARSLCIGDASHKAILEPHLFDADEWHKHWQLCPTESLVSKTALAALAEDPTRRMITADIIDIARRVRDAVYRHNEAKELLSQPGQSEAVVEAWDEKMECRRKIRIDRLPEDRAVPLLDIKTTHTSLVTQAFKGSVYQFGYHIQAAYYLDTLEMLEGQQRPEFKIIAVTKEAPFIARVFDMLKAPPDRNLYVKGKDIYEERLAAFVLAWHERQWLAYEAEEAALLAM